jgi:hypothetical protein
LKNQIVRTKHSLKERPTVECRVTEGTSNCDQFGPNSGEVWSVGAVADDTQRQRGTRPAAAAGSASSRGTPVDEAGTGADVEAQVRGAA